MNSSHQQNVGDLSCIQGMDDVWFRRLGQVSVRDIYSVKPRHPLQHFNHSPIGNVIAITYLVKFVHRLMDRSLRQWRTRCSRKSSSICNSLTSRIWMLGRNWHKTDKLLPSIDLHWLMLSSISLDKLYMSPIKELLVILVQPIRIKCSSFSSLEMLDIDISVSSSN